MCAVTEKGELALLVGFPEEREKLAAVQTAQDAHGKKEVVPATDPAEAVERDSAAGYDAVEVRVKPPAPTVP